MAKCEKWKAGCYECSQYKEYPEAFVDRTKQMWKLKRKWFTGVHDMVIVTPSIWLANLVKESYLKEYPVKVINNGIDLSVFKPTKSDFRKNYQLPADKYILLGVSFGWGKRKGLDVFVELASRLDNRFQIVLVGTDDVVDKQLPENIISIHRTQNQKELAEIYTAADLFVNPTREENYPTVNMEALACGTPVVTFNTGGSPEIITKDCGMVVNRNTVDELLDDIMYISQNHPITEESCLNRAKNFDMNERFRDYADLYRTVN
jgi:glycosyltransferase involved in cell wall biosynthesis